MTYFTYTESPLKKLLLVSDGTNLTGLYMARQQYEVAPADDWARDDSLPLFQKTVNELRQYFNGDLTSFSIPVKFQGSQFQRSVWVQLTDIPYGTRISYGDIARALGDPDAARTVGHAVGMNPISVIVPCHRVVSSSGSLTGYNGGLERKQFLLDLEDGKQRLALSF